MGPSWNVLDSTVAVLEPFWAVLERSSGPLRPSWAVLGASWAVLDALKTNEVSMLKVYVFLKEWDNLCLLGVPLGASWGFFGPLGPS